jgi:hypothetical protein
VGAVIYDGQERDNSVSKPPPALPFSQQQQQAQVFYIAVPSPDGRGQILQPVQMLQLPGKSYAYVVPGSGTIVEANPQVMMLPPTSNNSILNYSSTLENRSPALCASSYSVDSSLIDFAYDREEFPRSISNGDFAPDASLTHLYAAPHRPSLEEFLGHVRCLSCDPVGCRLVQHALDRERPMSATLIMNEG